MVWKEREGMDGKKRKKTVNERKRKEVSGK